MALSELTWLASIPFQAAACPLQGLPEWAATQGTKIVLGRDPNNWEPMSTACGAHETVVVEKVDLLKTVEPMRDSTLDGPHASSMTEAHFTHMCDPFDSKHVEAAASFKSAVLLRDAYRRCERPPSWRDASSPCSPLLAPLLRPLRPSRLVPSLLPSPSVSHTQLFRADAPSL